MKYPAVVAFLMLWLCAGCGKIGDPRPPSIHIPAKVTDFKAVQNQHQILLSWTNPSKYVDGTKATDLSNVEILRNGNSIMTLKVFGPGMPQSKTLEVGDAIGTTPIYALRFETQRGKMSDVSNEIPVVVLDVPGMVTSLAGVMDQHRIRLDWKPPDSNAAFADIYMVQRVGDDAPQKTSETHFEDSTVEESKSGEGKSKTYSYIVTAARGGTPPVPGPPSLPITVSAVDTTPPATPTGLQPPVVSGNGAILNWNANTETDLAGYKVYRSDNSNTGFTPVDAAIHANPSIRDEKYQPGSYYEVTAVDTAGNESGKSVPVTAP